MNHIDKFLMEAKEPLMLTKFADHKWLHPVPKASFFRKILSRAFWTFRKIDVHGLMRDKPAMIKFRRYK